jgi:hypothetical protein
MCHYLSYVMPSLVVGPNYADLCVGFTLNLALVAVLFVVLADLVPVAAVVTVDCGGVLLLLLLCLILFVVVVAAVLFSMLVFCVLLIVVQAYALSCV